MLLKTLLEDVLGRIDDRFIAALREDELESWKLSREPRGEVDRPE